MDTVRIKYMDGSSVVVVVPTEDGQECWIEFRRHWQRMSWETEISDGLIRQCPQAIHAALGLALMELKKVTP
jgi:hypothetical protein